MTKNEKEKMTKKEKIEVGRIRQDIQMMIYDINGMNLNEAKMLEEEIKELQKKLDRHKEIFNSCI